MQEQEVQFNEAELPDDRHVFHGYNYVINGQVVKLDLGDKRRATIAELKAGDQAVFDNSLPPKQLHIESFMNCDMQGRGLGHLLNKKK